MDQKKKRSGVGKALYARLLQELKKRGFYNAYAGITLPNPASVGFHESFGFEPVGVYKKIGYKNGSWHDVGWWALRLLADGKDKPQPPQF